MLVLHETDGLLMDVEEAPWDLQWRINSQIGIEKASFPQTTPHIS